MTGFNPRPPSLAGDPRIVGAQHAHVIVSIRARHHWRAILGEDVAGHAVGNVSIRARHHWRAIPAIGQLALDVALVSIRARHHWRAILAVNATMVVITKFQSAPAITGGRSLPQPTCR